MPRYSKRKHFISCLEELALLDEVCPDGDTLSNDEYDSDISEMSIDSSSSSGSDNDISGTEEEEQENHFTSPLFLLLHYDSKRYFDVKTSVPKSRHFIETILPRLSDERFKSEMRVSNDAFNYILEKIKGNRVFTNKSINKQFPVRDQLSVALYRFGRYGNGASVRDVAAHFGLGEGTIDLFTNRVIKAIMDLAPRYLRWYTTTEKEEMKKRIEKEKGFPNCLGFVDGTAMILDFKPGIDHESYFNRKSRYGLSAQIVSDMDDRIRFLFVGYPASVHDSRCIGYSGIITNPKKFFSGCEYVLADSAYTLSDTFITPFKQPLANTNQSYSAFNVFHSSARVHVEHCIGRLKSRFQSIRGLRIQILDRQDHKRACLWVIACCILHNMLINIDEWDVDEMIEEDVNNDPAKTGAPSSNVTAVEKRLGLVRELIHL